MTALAALALTACVYRIDIQQGNLLDENDINQVDLGMTRSQVQFLLGTPMVPDAFDDSRWDYYYFYSSRKFDQPLKRRLTVYFADERVQRVENQGVPTQTDLDQLEQDLRKAINAKKQAKKQQGQPEPEPDAKTSDDAGQPNPVPSSQPLPVPSGSSSDRP